MGDTGREHEDAPERIWDDYLTHQDRAHLARFDRKPVGFGRRPALVLVDLYRAAFGDAPQPLLEAIREWPSSCGRAAWSALPNIEHLLGRAREVGLPVVHVTGLEGDELASWSRTSAYAATADEPPPTEEGPAGHRAATADPYVTIVEPVAPRAGEVVIHKSAPSPFWGTPLAFHLVSLGIDTLIVCGESTSGCVRATVVDACTHRYRVVVPEECVFDRHEASHAMSLFDMHQKYADVLPLERVLEHLEGHGSVTP